MTFLAVTLLSKLPPTLASPAKPGAEKSQLAKAMINQPEVLFLDEPTASLDPDTADWVRGRLERLRDEAGTTIMLASHNMGEVERLCDRVLLMKAGEIVDDGAPGDLIARFGRQTMEEVFLDIARGRSAAVQSAQ